MPGTKPLAQPSRPLLDLVLRQNGVDPTQPLLYRISIGERRFYIGKARTAARPLNDYRRNLQRMVEGRPYRRQKPERFRPVHRAMHAALQQDELVVIDLLGNYPLDRLGPAEKRAIAEYRARYGREAVLNAT